MERRAERRTVQLQRRASIVIELVIDVAPHADQLAPAEGVAKARVPLIRVVRLAGADIRVVRQEPLTAVAEPDSAFRAEDTVPIIDAEVRRPLAKRPNDWAHVGAEVVAQALIQIEVTRSAEEVQCPLRCLHKAVATG